MSARQTKKKRKARPAAEPAPFWETKTLSEMSREEWESLRRLRAVLPRQGRGRGHHRRLSDAARLPPARRRLVPLL
jgi:hypothetical protein